MMFCRRSRIKRYITVDGKPLFVIFDPEAIPNSKEFISLWNKLAIKNNLKGVYFVGRCDALPNMNKKNLSKIDGADKTKISKNVEEWI